jgi:diguanylate cyclase (GGDEF)-like protein/PAS domain S-box-containing protein
MSQLTSTEMGTLGSLAIEQLNDLVYILDQRLCLVYVNSTACRVLGYAREELVGASATVIDAQTGVGAAPVAWILGERYTAETSLLSRDSGAIPVEVSVRVVEHAGALLRVVAARDLRERKRQEEQGFHTLVDNLPDVVVRYDLQLRRTFVNAAYHRVHGTTDEQVLHKLPGDGGRLSEPGAIALQELLRQTFATRVPCDHEFSLSSKDGSIFYWHLRVIPEFDQNRAVVSLLTVWTEVTERRHLLASLDRMAYHDALTGIANRALLIERLIQGLRAAEHRRDALALLFIDLDWFKIVNDRWGHDAGDTVLVATAQRLQSVVRDTDTVARFGGDEFVIVLAEMCDRAALAVLMERVAAVIVEPIIWRGGVLRVGASIGLARYPEDGLDAHALLRRADESMYTEKARRQAPILRDLRAKHGA